MENSGGTEDFQKNSKIMIKREKKDNKEIRGYPDTPEIHDIRKNKNRTYESFGGTEEFRNNSKIMDTKEIWDMQEFGDTQTSLKIMISGKNKASEGFGGTEEFQKNSSNHGSLGKRDI